MAPSQTRGPQCCLDDPVNIHDGTLSRSESPKPGPVGFWQRIGNDLESTFHNAEQVFSTDYQAARRAIQSGYDTASRAVRSDYEGALCIFQAYALSQEKAPAAILKETGYELGKLLKSLI